MPAWALFHLPVVLLPHQRRHLAQNVSMLLANGLMGAVNLQLYLWARSIWPCVALHLWWNLSNETLLGDVYGWSPGLFDGKFWVFNAEGFIRLYCAASDCCDDSLQTEDSMRNSECLIQDDRNLSPVGR
jgi:hypothetical protein